MTNLVKFFDVDSYKVSQHKQYPEGATKAMSYIEARGGADRIKFFGLQYILKQLEVPTVEDVRKAAYYSKLHFGRDDVFNFDGWMAIAQMGYFPLKIRAVKEGGVYPTSVPLATVENTHPDFVWLVSWFETQLLRVWYPSTVATVSFEIKELISKFLEKNGTPESIGFKLHDFGARGSTSEESAGIAGMAHLINFKGSDTLNGYMYASEYYNADLENTSFSIPASEHSTITSWGEKFEFDAFKNMIEQFGQPGALYACVSDSYSIWKALDKWKELEPLILETGGTLVVRPDSGDPVWTPIKVVMGLMDRFGYTFNEKGYKVLPDHIRVIQGDGIEKESIRQILHNLDMYRVSSDNIAFGMGGALHQKHDRDTFKFAMKMCGIVVNGEPRDVYKDPITAPDKKSKKGFITTVVDDFDGKICYANVPVGNSDHDTTNDLMRTVYTNGNLVKELNFNDIQ